MNDVMSCMEDSYEPDLTPAELARSCYDSRGERDDYETDWN